MSYNIQVLLFSKKCFLYVYRLIKVSKICTKIIIFLLCFLSFLYTLWYSYDALSSPKYGNNNKNDTR